MEERKCLTLSELVAWTIGCTGYSKSLYRLLYRDPWTNFRISERALFFLDCLLFFSFCFSPQQGSERRWDNLMIFNGNNTTCVFWTYDTLPHGREMLWSYETYQYGRQKLWRYKTLQHESLMLRDTSTCETKGMKWDTSTRETKVMKLWDTSTRDTKVMK
jgi:hypothetical protein